MPTIPFTAQMSLGVAIYLCFYSNVQQWVFVRILELLGAQLVINVLHFVLFEPFCLSNTQRVFVWAKTSANVSQLVEIVTRSFTASMEILLAFCLYRELLR